MATLTIPEDLYERLRAAAERERRPVEEVLRDAIERTVPAGPAPERPLTRDERTRLVREALGSQAWSEEDVANLFNWPGRTRMTPEEAERILSNMKPLDPPLSQTIIEMRDDEPS